MVHEDLDDVDIDIFAAVFGTVQSRYKLKLVSQAAFRPQLHGRGARLFPSLGDFDLLIALQLLAKASVQTWWKEIILKNQCSSIGQTKVQSGRVVQSYRFSNTRFVVDGPRTRTSMAAFPTTLPPPISRGEGRYRLVVVYVAGARRIFGVFRTTFSSFAPLNIFSRTYSTSFLPSFLHSFVHYFSILIFLSFQYIFCWFLRAWLPQA